MDTPFELLGVATDADDDAVEAAYRARIKDAHPDHGGTVHEFLRVRAAYQAIRSGEAPRDASDPTPTWDPVDDPAAEVDPLVTVEYLNYEVLDDHDWSLSDDDLFEKAAAADLDETDHGHVEVDPKDHLLESAEDNGQTWPYACRGGACANCAVAVTEGDVTMTVDNVLPDEMLDRDIRLSCVGIPTTDEVKVVYNVKGLPDLDDLRLPPYPFERSASAADD